MPEGQLQLLDDLPIAEHGQFQFDKYAKALTSAILLSRTPMTFGIFGDWGTGKTSLMNMIKNNIDNENSKVLTVWFDAWRYEKEPNIVVPLLYSIRDQIIATRHTASDEIVNFLGKFLLALGHGLETSVKAGAVSIDYKPKEVYAALKEFEERKSFGKAIYFDMFRYLKDELNKWDIKLVVFIDDLDRCNPESAITTLETIQLVLNMEKIVFVVGASNSTLEKAIDIKYSQLGVDGHSFLKKIFPASFTIPPLQLDQSRAFIEKLLINIGSSTEEKEILPKYFVHIAGANPRETKRIINTYAVMRELFDRESQDLDVSKLGLFVAIQHEWPRVLRNISTRRKDFIRFCEWFSKRKKNSKSSTPAWVTDMSIGADFLAFLMLSEAKLDFTEKDVDLYVNVLSTAALQSLFPIQIRFATSNKKEKRDGKEINVWSIWPDVTSYVLNRIDEIEYRLPTLRYTHNIRKTGPEDGFKLQEIASQDKPIEIEIIIRFKEFVQPEKELEIIDLTREK